VPLILGSAAASAMTLLDGLYLARYSPAAFNALVLALPLIGLVAAAAGSLAAAAADALARARGPRERAMQTAVAFALAAAFGIAALVAAHAGAERIAGSLRLAPDGPMAAEWAHFHTYWRWIAAGFPLQVIFTLQVQVLVALERSRTANRLILLLASVNAVLAPVLIYAAGMGVAGAALATDAAFLAGAVAASGALRGCLRAGWDAAPGEVLRAAARQVANGGVIFCAMAIYVVGDFLYARLAAGHGAAAVAVLGVSEQLRSLLYTLTRGVCSAYITVFGVHLARRRHDRYFPVYRGATGVTGVFLLTGAAVFLVAPRAVLRPYGLDPALTADAVFFLRVAAATLVVGTLTRVVQAGFLALGKPVGVALQSGLHVGIYYLAAAVLLERVGVRGLALGHMVGAVTSAAVMLPWFYAAVRRRARRDRAAEAHAAEGERVEPVPVAPALSIPAAASSP
jgi:Na+-driven multidrug efflux pump